MNAAPAAGARPAFDAAYLPLGGSTPLGAAALLPWDGEIFGFPVADFRPAPDAILAEPARLRATLDSWTRETGVELVACRVDARESPLAAALESAGFRFVETQLRVTRAPLRPAETPPARLTIRTASPADRESVVAIAASAFSLGRYHADPRFPRELADRRYRVWMERALSASDSGTWVGVLGPQGAAGGFLHAEISGKVADIRLAAVSPGSAGIGGPELFRGALHEFSRRGATQATARVSAANTGVMNVYAALGFRFHEPEVVLHWHCPGAGHLVPPDGPDR